MKRKIATLLVLLMAGWVASYGETADEYLNRPVHHKYRFTDNTFFTASAGVNLAMSDYVLKDKPVSALRPQVDIYYGKHLTKWFAARAGLGFLCQRAGVPKQAQNLRPDYCMPYSFGISSVKLDAMFCLDRIFTRYNPQERFQLWAFGGVGAAHTFEFQDKVVDYYYHMTVDSRGHFYGTWHAGLEGQWRVSDHCSVLLSGTWHWMSGDYNGARNFDGSSMQAGLCRNYATLNLGIVYRFTNQYGKTYFSDCARNENYYFDVMNDRLENVHGKNNMCESDSVLLFPQKYAYLTPQQKNKVAKMVRVLENDRNRMAVIDVYSDGIETSVNNDFRAKLRAERIVREAEKLHAGISDRIEIHTHTEASPYGSEHIWGLSGIIRYARY